MTTLQGIGTIEEEAAACRAAFANVEVGTLVMFCHHAIPLETLREPAEYRIQSILTQKIYREQALRLHFFRSVPGTYVKAREAWEAWEKAREARGAWVKAQEVREWEALKKFAPDIFAHLFPGYKFANCIFNITKEDISQ